MGRGYTSVGPMAPFYVFPCGHAFHAQCLIAHVTRCTVESRVNILPFSSCFSDISFHCDHFSCILSETLVVLSSICNICDKDQLVNILFKINRAMNRLFQMS